ncbi:hypothetical protein CC85DRAFT_177871 [Cutaneotrichosporon oleaginosum]|uniref:Uncharacterized protein n=1 Tax=Cutaneotrichosporon oleaginosum TaxID=879819 RepID=A0A0J1AX02_9TREE|nr:uncharacterized protein CC85DRAFT_177871 [Cutaneotrichosporon oleaginosum]KLT39834.1 hypothetical protein CC85DRAFT_177871 [Cutaneotrichosporon oleaginosum]TXT10358.1 hypothetical protein COLE_04292 [Cutaneotrichosporon oleaginosum]
MLASLLFALEASAAAQSFTIIPTTTSIVSEHHSSITLPPNPYPTSFEFVDPVEHERSNKRPIVFDIITASIFLGGVLLLLLVVGYAYCFHRRSWCRPPDVECASRASSSNETRTVKEVGCGSEEIKDKDEINLLEALTMEPSVQYQTHAPSLPKS